jgi:GNAT superfamily N-acetyltransferase
LSEFYSLRRNAITDISAFFGFVIGFLGSAPIAYPFLRVGFQTQEIVKGFAWFIGITFGSGVLLAIVGLGVGRALGWFWESSHKVVRRAKGQEFAIAAAGPSVAHVPATSVPLVARGGPADVAQQTIRYASGVDAQGFADLMARSDAGSADVTRLEAAMARTTNIGAWDGTRLVGALRILSDGYEWSVVTDILVDPAYRRRGIGRELMQRAASISSGRFAVAQIPPGTEGFFRRLDALPPYGGFVRGAKSRLQ